MTGNDILDDLDTLKIPDTTRYKKIAAISFVIVALCAGGNLVTYFETKYNLSNPLIPEYAYAIIAEPYLWTALAAAIFSIIGFAFYFFSRYTISIFISSAFLIYQVYLILI